jgi:DNA polymerase
MKNELLELTRSLRRRLDLSRVNIADYVPAAKEETAPTSSGDINSRIEACTACPLHATRIKTVPGVGAIPADVMFIGEGPGYMEDRQGEPFVGPAGQLLDKILASIGLSRQTVYIANIVKCHPMKDPATPEARGNDRPPTPEESASCRHFLDEQIAMVNPKVIVTLGATAMRELIGEASITRVRGQWREYKGVKLLPTFHPAALLRDESLKKDVWVDMKALKAELGL